jgi:hypothetical protein
MMSVSLFKRCHEFQKLAEKVSIVENTEPFLQRLSSLSFKEAIKFCDEHCEKKLGEGSSRAAYMLNDDLMLKVAFNPKGNAQCKVEANISALQFPCVNNALVADPEGRWIIFQATEKVTEKRFKELTGMSFGHFTDTLFYKFNNESDEWSKPKEYDEIVKNPFFLCVSNLTFECDEQIGDIAKISSFGERNGKILIVDGGLSRDVFEEFYAGDSSSSVKSTETSS